MPVMCFNLTLAAVSAEEPAAEAPVEAPAEGKNNRRLLRLKLP